MRLLTSMFAAALLMRAQTSGPAEMTIAQAVEGALRNYPSIRVTQEQINAAAAGIRLAVAHLVALILVWGGSGHRATRRRERD